MLIIIIKIIVIILAIGFSIVYLHYCELKGIYSNNSGIKGYWRYVKNEYKHRINGDERCDFTKLIERCRMLKSSRIIYNPGKCDNPAHQH